MAFAIAPAMVSLPAPPAPPVPPRRGGTAAGANLPPGGGGRGPMFYVPKQHTRRPPSFVAMPRRASGPSGRLFVTSPRPLEPIMRRRGPNELAQMLEEAPEDPAAAARRRIRELLMLQLPVPGDLDGGAGGGEGNGGGGGGEGNGGGGEENGGGGGGEENGGGGGGGGDEEEVPEPAQGARYGWFGAVLGAVSRVVRFVLWREDPPVPPAPPFPPLHHGLPPPPPLYNNV